MYMHRDMPGYYEGHGYYGGDGKLYNGIWNARDFGPGTFTEGDNIGCGIRDGRLFFKKNGQYFATRIHIDGK